MVICGVCNKRKRVPRCDSHPKTLDTCYICHLLTPVKEGGHTINNIPPPNAEAVRP